MNDKLSDLRILLEIVNDINKLKYINKCHIRLVKDTKIINTIKE